MNEIEEIYANSKSLFINEIKKRLLISNGKICLMEAVSTGTNRCHNESWEGKITDIMFAKKSDNLISDVFTDIHILDTDIVYRESGCYDAKLDELSLSVIYQIAKACDNVIPL